MQHLFGPKFGGLMEGAVVMFLFCLFVAMLAGAGATGREAFGIPFTASSLAIGLCVFFVLCFGLNGVVKVNIVLAPFMLLGGIFIGLYTFFMRTSPSFAMSPPNPIAIMWLLSALVYASYNLVTGIPILAATSGMVTKKRDAALGGLLGGGVILVLGICMALPLFLYRTNIINFEIPFLYIVTHYGGGFWLFRLFYLGVLISAIMTTAACNAFAVSEWLRAREFGGKVIIAACICGMGVLISHIGFSNIVAYIYPLFGLLGVFKVVTVLWHGFSPQK